MRSLTALALRRPRSVLAVWGAVILVFSAIGLGAQSRLSSGSIETPGSQTARASALDRQDFGPNETVPVLLTGPAAALDRQGPRLVRTLRREWSVLSPWDPGRASQRLRPAHDRALVLVNLTAGTQDALVGHVGEIRDAVRRTIAAPVSARVTGFTAIGEALRDETLRSAALAEKISIPILIVVLLLVFRAPVAAVVPGIMGFATVSASAGLIWLLAHRLELTALAVSTAAMMGLALGVDYSLLIVSRFREEMAASARVDPADAARTAAATAGRTVLFAGAVLLIAMLVAVVLSPGDVLVSVTVGVTIAVVLSMLSGAIVVPALLLLLGSRVDRWSVGGPPRPSRVLPALAGYAVRGAPIVLLLSLLALLLPGLLALRLHTAALNPQTLPPGDHARRDFEGVAQLVGAGYVMPFEIALHTPRGLIAEPRTLTAIERFQQRLLRDPGVAGLVGPGALASRGGSVLEVPRQIPALRRQAERATRAVDRLRAGLLTASEGAGRLRDGAAQAQTGVTQLQGGARQLGAGAAALHGGVRAAAAGTSSLAAGESAAARGASRLHDGASVASDGSRRLLQGIDTIGANASEVTGDASRLAAGLLAASHGVPGQLNGPIAATAQQLRAAYDALTRMTSGRDDPNYDAALAAVGDAAGTASGTNPVTGGHVPDSLPSALAAAVAALQASVSQANDLRSSATSLAAVVGQAHGGAASLSGGLARLERGQAQLSSGLDDAARRVAAARSRFDQLAAGAGRVAAGTTRLSDGIGALGGIGELARGGALLAARLGRGYREAAPLAPGLRRSARTISGFPQLRGERAAGYLLLAGAQSASAARRSQLEYVLDLRGPGQGARMFVFPRRYPASDAGAHLNDRLVRETAAFARAHGVEAGVGGPAARFTVFQRVVSAFIPRLILVLSLLTFLLLVVILRALLVPAIAIALNLAVVAATFGLMKAVFQGAHPLLGGPGFIDVTSAAGIFTVLFALSVDYQVFLLTRMREGFLRSGDADAAIDHGIAHTARVVTGAAMIMATVFLSFGASRFAIPLQLGVGLAIAVLLDALLLRLFMLPAAMHLVGSRGWWLPAWLDRALPHFDPEGAG
ncbi:MAG TPA: MMPL family transporter [Conexibacter sp.]|nr:MMPL family transporter [Conexibacter sp.]